MAMCWRPCCRFRVVPFVELVRGVNTGRHPDGRLSSGGDDLRCSRSRKRAVPRRDPSADTTGTTPETSPGPRCERPANSPSWRNCGSRPSRARTGIATDLWGPCGAVANNSQPAARPARPRGRAVGARRAPGESGAGGGLRRGERGRRKLGQRPLRMGAYGWLGCRPGPVHLWLTGPAGSRLGQGMGLLVDDALDLAAVYTDLHAHPELGFHETRTAALVAVRLSASGFGAITGVGGTGVVGVLGNGDGPLVLLRADMDALPVEEKTRLPYASVARAVTDSGIDVPVMHACGHDVHVTCLLGACAVLSADSGSWSGTLVVVFQPAEELGAGARAMVEDGLFDRFDRPAVVLGQHVAPLPAGIIGFCPRGGLASPGHVVT